MMFAHAIERMKKEDELIAEWVQSAAHASTDEEFMRYVVAIDRINHTVEQYR